MTRLAKLQTAQLALRDQVAAAERDGDLHLARVLMERRAMVQVMLRELQGWPVPACSPIASWATPPSPLSSGTPTHVGSCVSDGTPDGSLGCRCTKATFGCSIHPPGPDEWIASMQASLARILASPELGRASMASTAGSIEKSSAALTWFDPATCSWKTPQQSLFGDWAPFSATWPRDGSMRGGRCWPLLMWVRPISVNDGGVSPGGPRWQTPVSDDAVEQEAGKWNSRGEPKLWPTPTSDGKGGPRRTLRPDGREPTDLRSQVLWVPTPTSSQPVQVRGRGAAALHPNRGTTLAGYVTMFPTPAATDGKTPYRGASREKQMAKRSKPLRDFIDAPVGGQLNPTWVEWLMGWPLGWTVCAASVTAKSRSVRRSRGASSEGQSVTTERPGSA